jgi:hypothetical protein
MEWLKLVADRVAFGYRFFCRESELPTLHPILPPVSTLPGEPLYSSCLLWFDCILREAEWVNA